jgi:hypothetical protein
MTPGLILVELNSLMLTLGLYRPSMRRWSSASEGVLTMRSYSGQVSGRPDGVNHDSKQVSDREEIYSSRYLVDYNPP